MAAASTWCRIRLATPFAPPSSPAANFATSCVRTLPLRPVADLHQHVVVAQLMRLTTPIMACSAAHWQRHSPFAAHYNAQVNLKLHRLIRMTLMGLLWSPTFAASHDLATGAS